MKNLIEEINDGTAAKIIEGLVNLGANVKIYDPLASSIKTAARRFNSEARIKDVLSESDCAGFVTNNDSFRLRSKRSV